VIGVFSSPVTDGERRRWQRRATRVLDRLLGVDLPPLTWTIGPTATLVGRVLDGADDTRRADWQAWVTAMQATPAPESTDAGVTHLRATVADRNDPLVLIVLLATVFDPDPDGW
jgi:hypothetical protein